MRRIALALFATLGVGSCHTDWFHRAGLEVAAPPTPIATIAIESFARDGAAIAIGRAAGRTLAFVADEDEDAVHTIDLDQRVEIARTELDGRPSAVLALPSGELAVALRDDASIALLAMTAPNEPLLLRAAISTADEPIALATSPDARTLWVASGVGRALEGFSLGKLEKRATIALGREPRALTISSDGARAFVGYMSESGIGAVDLATRSEHLAALGTAPVTVSGFTTPMSKPPAPCGFDPFDDLPCKSHKSFNTFTNTIPGRLARQTFALVRMGGLDEQILAPNQLVGPGEPLVITGGYGDSFQSQPVMFDLAKLDGRTGIGKSHTLDRAFDTDCRLPRGAALDPKHGHIAVACLGSNAVAIYNAAHESPASDLKVRVGLGGGPTAVAFDPVHETFVALSSFSRRVHVVTTTRAPFPIALSHQAGKGLSPEAAEGRKLFFAADDDRISADGRACASCHPDGRDDGLVWPTPKGPRQTVLLAGRLARPAPFGWDGKHESLVAHMKVTMTNLRGFGLPDKDLTKLAAYLVTLPAPPKREHDLSPTEEKGRALFASTRTGCASCHTESTGFTDGEAHDVASATKVDKNKSFLAPSLRFIGASAPYFHDGRYPTLASMLRATDSAMGSTSDLKDDELDALEAYLKTL